MRPDTPRRLPSFPYVGLHRYFVTICTHTRRSVFVSGAVVATVEQRLRESAERHGFSPYAYCFMPDHVHVLLVAERENADLRACVRLFKQTSAFDVKRMSGGDCLWQQGYHERVVRSDEASMSVARYILENPVRAGLTRTFQDYPFSGSAKFTKAELADLWDLRG